MCVCLRERERDLKCRKRDQHVFNARKLSACYEDKIKISEFVGFAAEFFLLKHLLSRSAP